MATIGRPAVDTRDYIAALRTEGTLLARSAGQVSLDTLVPTCPGWRLRDLLRHLGYVHRWAAGYVREQHATMVDRLDEAGVLGDGPPDESLPSWFRAGHEDLVSVLERADPALLCWTFLEAASPLAFWARRQAHETTIHRVDTQLAAAAAAGPAASADPVPDEFAADGIDELLMGFARRDAKRGPLADPPRTLSIDAGPGRRWVVRMGPDRSEVARGSAAGPPGPADCSVTGRPADLYLLLWNRREPAGLEMRGDAGVLDAWRRGYHVRWR
jgi:uncharacterized protein (TIGR03083 family)